MTIRYGDRLEGGKEGVDGEVRGGEIAGNVTRQKLVAGEALTGSGLWTLGHPKAQSPEPKAHCSFYQSTFMPNLIRRPRWMPLTAP